MDEQQELAAATAALGIANTAVLARGGQKVVYTATRGTDPVILKVVRILGARDPNALERCQREVELLRKLGSDHIVRVVSGIELLGQAPDAAAWLEERLDGEDFIQLTGTPWAWAEVQDLLAGVAAGLAEMHKHAYIHRDLSASNVRRTSTGVWKIMDPGLAKHLNRSSITGPWQPGTPGYLSPEHVSVGGRILPASDVFCLGILAFQALTTGLPISAADPMVYRRLLMSTSAPSVATLRPDLTGAQAALIDGCLERQPARRFLDAGELLESLASL